ncbi:malate synthase A [Xanthomonas vasicola]|uniref:malate synthase n=2 Tax=Xanthomonas vasicola TaxID=56459 RepID=A0A836ZSN9_XANVA|nr:malate synthase A [Xanthomonas vasicola]AZR25355.1 malate synthase A [Xanthomonas vasicola pv. arecae]KFA29173.1 malate synthase [Xanthomonas vasicola pv. vasculorum NCPPB 1326]KFA31198.1 malate synthase [Xanthomonas vasicola pv. vasculorum NCPPB 1381]KFA38157.1 malate synthase [Xanthomonas vasicola pv. vasculorum NCPPB 206]MBV6745975.1 malate synthase A [Xanthomonas vasicola pv. vasculorum NCPPB 890]
MTATAFAPRPIDHATPGISLTTQVAGQAELLPAAALALLVSLHRAIEPGRQQRLAQRREHQAALDAGQLPDFRADTQAIRAGDWRVAALPAALQDRRVEITGPTDPKMVINALNSGAKVFMADFEDSTAPTWRNLLAGQRTLAAAVRGDLSFDAPNGKRYTLRPEAERAVLIVRPRGWHLDEKHVLIDGQPLAGGLFDAALFAFHNGRALLAKDRGPYLYLSKLQSMEEAALWDTALAHIEAMLGLPHGQIKVTVLIETLPAVFEMDEILHALRERIVGLNCGRWDYIFSYLKTLRAHRDRVLPERGQVTMTQPFLKAYSELLIKTCHRRGAHAMGGMAAQIPINHDEAANEQAMARVRADKLREVTAGHDGTWVAHPALIPVAMKLFDEHMPTAHQHHVLRNDVQVTRDMLIAPSPGNVTRAGFEGNVEVCVRYLAAWLDGNGCVPIHNLMEDAATAEISRAQLWQWLHHGQHLDDGTAIDQHLLQATLHALPARLGTATALPGAARINEAIALLEELSRADELADFLTVPAYRLID